MRKKHIFLFFEILIFTLIMEIFRFFPHITLVNFCFQATGHSFHVGMLYDFFSIRKGENDIFTVKWVKFPFFKYFFFQYNFGDYWCMRLITLGPCAFVPGSARCSSALCLLLKCIAVTSNQITSGLMSGGSVTVAL